MRRVSWTALLLGALAVLPGARGDVLIERVDERRGDVLIAGEMVHDPAATATPRRPGVLLVDDTGDPSASRQRAAAWARQGRVVLRLDPPTVDRDRDGPLAQRSNRRAMRAQAEAALAHLRRDARVDNRDVAVVGYNGGAAVALDLATAGIALDGVACVGGNPEPPSAEAARRIDGRVLLVVRPEDPVTPPARRRNLEEALRRGEVDWRVVRTGPAEAAGKTNGAPAPTATDPDGVVEAFLTRLWSAPPGRNGTAPPATVATRPPPAPSTSPATNPAPKREPPPARPALRLPRGVPAKVADVLAHIDRHGEAMDGYVGGRGFVNAERLLPQTDRQGRRIRYREWDVNPLRPGVNRGAERLVTGNDGSAYYTRDHYESFTRIR